MFAALILLCGMTPGDIGESGRGPSLGPVSLGPVSLGPVSLGPVSLGPVSLGPVTFDDELQRYVAPWGDHLAVLSLDEILQERLEADLVDGRVPWGATILIEVKTGRVLALAEHSEREPGTPVARRALAPAASVFKIVSSASLLRAGVPPQQRICTHGGHRRLKEAHLVDNASKDRHCLSFADVLPYSANTAMARLVDKYVPVGGLLDEARRWGFDTPLVFPLPVEASPSFIVAGERFRRAESAAGFGGARLSALHAALLAAAVANRGLFLGPRLIDATSGGPPVPVQAPVRVLAEPVADDLAAMMVDVVERGTATRAFSEREASLDDVSVGGKTGTLMDYEQHVDVTWWVGFAPAADPEIAVATVIVNDWKLWWVKALTVGRRALATYFEERPLSPAPELPPWWVTRASGGLEVWSTPEERAPQLLIAGRER